MELETKERKEFKHFKIYLLRSGIPLEASITQKVQIFDLIDKGEYFYERNGKVFSVDINATGFLDFEKIHYRDNLIALDLLIECKYHEEDRKWAFMSFKKPRDFSFRVNTRNVFIEFPLKKRLNEYGYYQKYQKRKYKQFYPQIFSKYFPKNLRKVHKGIEIHKGGFNPKSISESRFQLLFGLGKKISEGVKDLYENSEEKYIDGDEYFYRHGLLGYFLLPIIVTTAELYVLKPEITVEDIKQSKNLEQIAENVKAVFYEQGPHLELEDFIRKSFTFKEEMLKSQFFTYDNIDSEISIVSNIEPRILIINYYNFEEIFQLFLKELNLHLKELSQFWTRVRKKSRR